MNGSFAWWGSQTVADNRYENLFAELASKSKLTRDDLTNLVQKKKSTVGDGYLTDQGALFLVASDLDVSIDYKTTTSLRIADISKSQESITTTCRILSVGCPKSFTKKDDSTKGVLLRLIVYDCSATTWVSLWDEAVLSFLQSDIGPGDVIKLSNAYTRLSLDGSVNLNIGERSSFEKSSDEKDIKKLSERAVPISLLPSEGKSLVVSGSVQGDVRRSTFSRSDGSSSELTSFTIGDSNKRTQRVVIWGNPNPTLSLLRHSEQITLLNVGTKISNFNSTVAIELHGDDTTCILEHWDETKSWMKQTIKNWGLAGEGGGIPMKKVARTAALPFIARVISRGHGETEGKSFLLVLDSQKRMISLAVSGEALADIAQLRENDLILCKPETFDDAGLRASVSSAKSITKLSSKRNDIPTSDSIVTTVGDIKEGVLASMEVMCLTDSVAREIQTKDGLVRRTELTVADHTGEIRIYAWRSLSKVLEDLSAGEKIFLGAVESQIHDGKKFLQLRNYSSMKRLEG